MFMTRIISHLKMQNQIEIYGIDCTLFIRK